MTVEPTRPDDPMRLSGARWCPPPPGGHGRWECSKPRSKGRGICHQPAIGGTDACRMHAGSSASVARSKGEANLVAWSLTAAGDLPSLDLHEQMLALIHMTAARHAVYAEELREQYEAEQAGGLVGATWAVGRGGEAVQSGEQLRGLTKLEGDERDRLARYLKDAHAMGIATQVIELAQGQAEIVVLAFRAALEAAGPELLPGVRAAMVETFLGRLSGGDVVAGELVTGASS